MIDLCRDYHSGKFTSHSHHRFPLQFREASFKKGLPVSHWESDALILLKADLLRVMKEAMKK